MHFLDCHPLLICVEVKKQVIQCKREDKRININQIVSEMSKDGTKEVLQELFKSQPKIFCYNRIA
jgi:hypothetical protein